MNLIPVLVGLIFREWAAQIPNSTSRLAFAYVVFYFSLAVLLIAADLGAFQVRIRDF